jgi:SAM-dependent methyltransferase
MVQVGTRNQLSREVWLKDTLKKVPPDSRILDAGAGELKYKPLCSHLKYISQDFAQYDGKGDSKGLQTGSRDQSKLDIISDITSIPESDESFDAIMCIEVFEHLPEPIEAIKEFSRLLRPGGHLILTAPFCSLTHFAPYHFYSGFNKYFFEKYLQTNGFEILDLQSNGNFFEYLAQEISRINSIANKYTEKEKCNFIDFLIIVMMLKMLERFSQKDNGSSELLNFGFHVYARKANKFMYKNEGFSCETIEEKV